MTRRVGFIGVGLMGHGMARSIIDKGRPLTVLAHRRRAAVDDLVGRGATLAGSIEELARNSDVIFLCMPGSAEVESVVLQSKGLKDSGRDGLIVIDCSTSDPDSTIALARELASRGIAFCDAPLGGTPAQASQGQLSTLVGCDLGLWPAIEQSVCLWAARAVRVGPAGTAHRLKLLMNFLSLGYAALYAEMLALARKCDLSPQTLDLVIRGSRMDCGVYQTFFRWVLERDAEAHKFTLTNAHKDLRYLAAMAAAARVPDHLGTAVRGYFAAAEARGHGDDFVPMLADIVAEMNGVTLVST